MPPQVSSASQYADAAEALASAAQLVIDTRWSSWTGTGRASGYVPVSIERLDEMAEAIDNLTALAHLLEE